MAEKYTERVIVRLSKAQKQRLDNKTKGTTVSKHIRQLLDKEDGRDISEGK